MLTRRDIIRSSAVLGLAGALPVGNAIAQTPVAPDEAKPKLGDTHEIFDDAFGYGMPSHPLTIYELEDEDRNRTDHWVLFHEDDGYAQLIDTDHYGYPNSGIVSSEETLGVSQFTPEDAELHSPLVHVGTLNPDKFCYHLRLWRSEALANNLDLSGIAVVVNEDTGVSGNHSMGDWTYYRSVISTETPSDQEIVYTGELPNPASDPESVLDAYAMEAPSSSSRYRSNNPPIPGEWLYDTELGEFDVTFDDRMSDADCAELIGRMLPEDSDEVWATFIPTSPISPWGLRINWFNTGSQEDVVVLRQVSYGVSDYLVERLIFKAVQRES